MKLYLDMNAYNRIFDDQNQLRIRFEAMAIVLLWNLYKRVRINWYGHHWRYKNDEPN